MIQMPLLRPKKGDTGVKGDTGAEGPPGSPGGLQGDTGVAGSQGDTGASGSDGIQGDTGAGVKGDTGSSGLSGDKGDTGAQGDTGAGIQGDTGVEGLKGDTGDGAGPQGDTGVQGAKGDTGAGFTGDTGVKGDTGIQGDTGVGEKGDTGSQGIKGDTGEGTAVGYIDDLLDVTTPAPTRNHSLKWNGSQWVSAPYNYDFALTIATFADDQADTQLIGSGTWRTTGLINFTASYNNGPPDSASIALTSDGGVTWGSAITLINPFTSASSLESTIYPTAKDRYIRFTLTAIAGVDTPTALQTVYFRNNIKYGATIETSGWDSADINALAGTLLSNAFTGSFTVSCGSGEYILYAYPSSYSSINTTGFLFNSVTCPFEAATTITVTNSAGFAESYRVYRSTNSNLGSSNLVTSTSSNLIDPIYWGVSTVDSGYTQSDIKALASSAISNTKTRTFSLTAGAGERYVYSLPTRLNSPLIEIWINGVDQTGGFTKETVSVTNVNGYSENYDIYYSNNEGLGVASVEIK